MKNNAPLRYQFITPADRDLFGQYIQLRRRVYLREYPWLPQNFGFEDATDLFSETLVAELDGRVVAGARLTISTPQRPLRMPLEEDGLSLPGYDRLADLDLYHNPYGEISRMVVDPTIRRAFGLSDGLGDRLCRRAAVNYEVDTLFCICPEGPLKINQRNAKKHGVRFELYGMLPTVFQVEMMLCGFLELRKIYTRNESEAA